MNTTLTIKTQKKLRDDAKRVAGALGIPLTIAVNALLRQFVKEERIVFETEKAHLMTRKLEHKLLKIDADIQSEQNLSPAFFKADDAIRWLHAR